MGMETEEEEEEGREGAGREEACDCMLLRVSMDRPNPNCSGRWMKSEGYRFWSEWWVLKVSRRGLP